MVKYNDYPDKYPEQIIEKLNTAYSNFNLDNKEAQKVENIASSLSLIDHKVEISSESKCELDGKLINLLEKLNKCEGLLHEIKKMDKSNKKIIDDYIQKTKNNKIEIFNCCYNNQDISCDYYATCSPSFHACCSNYCVCECDVLEQLMSLWGTCNCMPINQTILINLINCRLSCLKGIICKYALNN